MMPTFWRCLLPMLVPGLLLVRSSSDDAETDVAGTIDVRVDFMPGNCDKQPKSKNGMAVAITLEGFIAEESLSEGRGTQFVSFKDEHLHIVLGALELNHLWGSEVGEHWKDLHSMRGLHSGLLDMCVGEKRTIIVPPYLAFGDIGRDPEIPPQASLRFAVELVGLGRPTHVDRDGNEL
eukprot:TRINITY_DN11615_c0_g1_i1.p1 TRINITY_DN11615_c0_g1~~TRINITY_DN11615_c0_g1_i1.p1  ORF type:complete len:178 (-),score=33.99 TRINITY_DN11615_c0_g1_i1:63-596(-)